MRWIPRRENNLKENIDPEYVIRDKRESYFALCFIR
jgi:hypothetical protein